MTIFGKKIELPILMVSIIVGSLLPVIVPITILSHFEKRRNRKNKVPYASDAGGTSTSSNTRPDPLSCSTPRRVMYDIPWTQVRHKSGGYIN